MDQRRIERYGRITRQLEDLIADTSPSLTAGMATICAVLHAKMPHHFWTGFYLVVGDELHVGPYQGPLACQVLKGSGVCLHAAQTRSAVVVPDVSAFPGHVACDARSKSEIVIPMLKDGVAVAVLDIDAAELHAFTDADIEPLTDIVHLLDPLL